MKIKKFKEEKPTKAVAGIKGTRKTFYAIYNTEIESWENLHDKTKVYHKDDENLIIIRYL